MVQLGGGGEFPHHSAYFAPPLSLNSSMMMIGVCETVDHLLSNFPNLEKKTVVGDYINTMKTTLDFSFYSYQAVKQHGYK